MADGWSHHRLREALRMTDQDEVERLRSVADKAKNMWVALDRRDMTDEQPWQAEAHALWMALAELDAPGITAQALGGDHG